MSIIKRLVAVLVWGGVPSLSQAVECPAAITKFKEVVAAGGMIGPDTKRVDNGLDLLAGRTGLKSQNWLSRQVFGNANELTADEVSAGHALLMWISTIDPTELVDAATRTVGETLASGLSRRRTEKAEILGSKSDADFEQAAAALVQAKRQKDDSLARGALGKEAMMTQDHVTWSNRADFATKLAYLKAAEAASPELYPGMKVARFFELKDDIAQMESAYASWTKTGREAVAKATFATLGIEKSYPKAVKAFRKANKKFQAKLDKAVAAIEARFNKRWVAGKKADDAVMLTNFSKARGELMEGKTGILLAEFKEELRDYYQIAVKILKNQTAAEHALIVFLTGGVKSIDVDIVRTSEIYPQVHYLVNPQIARLENYMAKGKWYFPFTFVPVGLKGKPGFTKGQNYSLAKLVEDAQKANESKLTFGQKRMLRKLWFRVTQKDKVHSPVRAIRQFVLAGRATQPLSEAGKAQLAAKIRQAKPWPFYGRVAKNAAYLSVFLAALSIGSHYAADSDAIPNGYHPWTINEQLDLRDQFYEEKVAPVGKAIMEKVDSISAEDAADTYLKTLGRAERAAQNISGAALDVTAGMAEALEKFPPPPPPRY